MEISYRIVKETVCIDKIENPGTVVVVPEEVEGRPVTTTTVPGFSILSIQTVSFTIR